MSFPAGTEDLFLSDLHTVVRVLLETQADCDCLPACLPLDILKSTYFHYPQIKVKRTVTLTILGTAFVLPDESPKVHTAKAQAQSWQALGYKIEVPFVKCT